MNSFFIDNFPEITNQINKLEEEVLELLWADFTIHGICKTKIENGNFVRIPPEEWNKHAT